LVREFLHAFVTYVLSYMTGYSYMPTQFLCEEFGNSEKSSEALKIQNVQFEKEKVSGFDQPLFRANLTADRIWLADLPCCAIGVQQLNLT
jgi:hypothetical protein